MSKNYIAPISGHDNVNCSNKNRKVNDISIASHNTIMILTSPT